MQQTPADTALNPAIRPDRFWLILTLLCTLLLCATVSRADGFQLQPSPQAAPESLDPDQAFLLSFYLDDQDLVLDWQIAPGYYLYRDQFHVKQSSSAITDTLFSENSTDKYDPTADRVLPVFHDQMSVRLVTEQLHFPLSVDIVYQGCSGDGLCYPPQKKTLTFADAADVGSMTVTRRSRADLAETPDTPLPPEEPEQPAPVWLAVLMAFAGGLLLNLMPCVFPVLSLKALQLSRSRENIREARLHALFYSAGVIISFLSVAALLITLRQLGSWTGWGYQLQSPLFVTTLLLLFYVMALSLSGLLTIGTRFMNAGQGLTRLPGHTGSFFTGVLATVVATPCTAPFMGTAIAVALSQSLPATLLIFLSMGAGMALPLALISAIPTLCRVLPAPGPWMETFSRIMALPLFVSAIWLVTVLLKLLGEHIVFNLLTALLLISFAFWPVMARPASGRKQTLQSAFRIMILAAGLTLLFSLKPEPRHWEDYSAARLAQYQANNEAVFVDVTAAWCITCKVNEKVALSGSRFTALAEEKNIHLLRADWTSPSAETDSLIARHGRNGVPLYLMYYPGKKDAVILPQILSPGIIEQTFNNR